MRQHENASQVRRTVTTASYGVLNLNRKRIFRSEDKERIYLEHEDGRENPPERGILRRSDGAFPCLFPLQKAEGDSGLKPSA